MDCSCKYAPKDYPDECRRPEHYTEDGSEDGACASNVEELDKIDFPCLHRYIVHSVVLCISNGLA